MLKLAKHITTRAILSQQYSIAAYTVAVSKLKMILNFNLNQKTFNKKKKIQFKKILIFKKYF